MLNNLLEIVPGTGDKAGNYYFDNMGEPFVYALIGFVVVFLGIVVIIAVIWLLGLLMRKTNNFAFLLKFSSKFKTSIKSIFKRKDKKHNDESLNVVESESESDVPDEVKAAIIAAIMAYYETSTPQCEFKVKRIKRL